MAESAVGTQITLNDMVMSLNEIGQALSAGSTGRQQPQIILLIDPKVPTAMYFDAMDMLRKVGMDGSTSILKWSNPSQAPDVPPAIGKGNNENGPKIEIQ